MASTRPASPPGRVTRALVRERLARQFLLDTPHETGRDVVRALGAVQSQDYLGATWALAQRTAGATAADIEREFASGAILRTHVLRPTWHFVDPADIRWMLALTAPRVKAAMASYNRKLELDARVFRRSHTAVEKALAAGFCTRAELRAVLVMPAASQSCGASRPRRKSTTHERSTSSAPRSWRRTACLPTGAGEPVHHRGDGTPAAAS